MRLIPVIDLKDNLAVHGIRGERQHYRAVQSVLCATAEPRAVARAFRQAFGLDEIYVADLDAIQGVDPARHRALIASLVQEEGLRIILDAGVDRASAAQEWLDLGIHRVVIGAETLADWDTLASIPATVNGEKLVFSLDLRGGVILSRCARLAGMAPLEALDCLQACGWREVILLDLARVGNNSGVDTALVAEACARFPDLALIAGGGVRGLDDLKALRALGVAGVLVATALHRGLITPGDLDASIPPLLDGNTA